MQNVSRIVFDATIRDEHSLDVVYSHRLESQIYLYTKNMILSWIKAQRFSREKEFIRRITGDCSMWRCKILAEEFRDLGQFRKSCIEHEMYEANWRRAKLAERVYDDNETEELLPADSG